ncbi:PTS system mannose/fructose/sorbose family transporter subunit IID [Collinsella sp. zg1085]|uniref:PTS system mannose/fructose/sorbose family transporter subunit IID n=1 Tax=Collinsella sp. zg1085 TaxID=2844380 RepID=UPI001C0D3FA6|nr:PTS system mannose/fructose/sorbose family transporter subunit IID [Collinsella sp. zg1085]QWT17294.1 PTS system mannose/fructose/sorbose family transporter subunit IID [Collinsella sp. zg1085]
MVEDVAYDKTVVSDKQVTSEVVTTGAEASRERITLSNRIINRVIARWYINCEISLNYERMQSIAFTDALMPALKKLYPEREPLREAMKRHMELFNTNATAGGLILGTVLAMEEEKANNPDAIPGESIIAVKTGLMGPCAAFGDSFSAGTITTLFILAACALAQQGNYMGLLVLFLGAMVTLGELIFTTKLTYKQGRSAIKGILSSKLMSELVEGANILGMSMMGALTASMVALSLALSVSVGESFMVIQDQLNTLMPGLLQLAILFVYYLLIHKKHASIVKLVLGTLIASLLFAALGVV